MSKTNFLAQIKVDIDKALIEPINEAVGEAGLAGLEEAYKQSRFWTGRLRSSWRLTRNRATRGKGSPPKKDQGKGVDLYAAESNAAIQSAHAVAERYDVTKDKGIALGNNVPYGEKRDANVAAAAAKTKMESVLNRRFSRIL